MKRKPKVIAKYKITDLLYMIISHIGSNDPEVREMLRQSTGFKYNKRTGEFQLIQHPVKDGVYDTRGERDEKS